jgi:hypothetical protein
MFLARCFPKNSLLIDTVLRKKKKVYSSCGIVTIVKASIFNAAIVPVQYLKTGPLIT